MKKYAYIRVSSKDQNIARQVEAMKSIGISEKDMFINNPVKIFFVNSINYY